MSSFVQITTMGSVVKIYVDAMWLSVSGVCTKPYSPLHITKTSMKHPASCSTDTDPETDDMSEIKSSSDKLEEKLLRRSIVLDI